MQHHINSTYKRTTWNFLESGHGKGPADGIGAAIKRNADAYIASSNNVAGENRAIVDAATMYRALIRQGTTLDLFLIDEEEFQASSAQLRSMNPNRVPGTMKLHQVIFDKPGTIKYRDVSCFCDNCEHDFTQFQLLDKVDKPTDENNNVIDKDGDLIGQWCCVSYEGKMYPGKIVDVDDNDVEVNCMSRVGNNRYYWPLFKDQIWYSIDDILGIIPEPKHVTARHLEIDSTMYDAIMAKLKISL